MKSLNYDEIDIYKIYEEVAKEFNVSPDLVEECIRHQFKATREFIQHKRMYDVLLHNFGSYVTPVNLLRSNIKKIIGAYKKGRMSKGKFEKTFAIYWRKYKKAGEVHYKWNSLR